MHGRGSIQFFFLPPSFSGLFSASPNHRKCTSIDNFLKVSCIISPSPNCFHLAGSHYIVAYECVFVLFCFTCITSCTTTTSIFPFPVTIQWPPKQLAKRLQLQVPTRLFTKNPETYLCLNGLLTSSRFSQSPGQSSLAPTEPHSNGSDSAADAADADGDAAPEGWTLPPLPEC